MTQWIRWLIPIAIVACGVAALLAGFAYGLAFAGIPYQDPPPELAARYVFHSHIASVIEWGGLLTVAIGMMGLLAVAVWTLSSRRSLNRELRDDATEGKPAGE